MEALQFTLKSKKLEYVKLPIPEITAPDQVLVKVAYAGVCGTDLHIMAGEYPFSEKTTTLGHEFSGTVVDIGADVKNVKKGDKVAIDPNDGCRCCDYCHNGNPNYCKTGAVTNTIGLFRDGGWASYSLVPMNTVSKLPDSISLEQGSLAEPISCLAHGWDLVSPVRVGSKILVIGAGIIGNLWVCLLHLQGHRRVTVSEPNVNRLNFVKKLETGYALITPDQLKKNQEADPDYLFDVVIDCSGFCPAVEHAISLLDKGGKLCTFGIAPPNAKISVSPFEMYVKELKIFAVHINPYSFVKSIGFIDAMGSRYIDFEKLGIQVYPLKDYEKALAALKAGTIAKAVFKL